MMSSRTTVDYALIQRFFEWELTEEELELFEERMRTDEQFFHKVQTYQYVDEKITKDFTAASFEDKQQLQKSWNRMFKKQSNKRKRLRAIKTLWTAAASIVLLIAAMIWFWSSHSNSSYQQLALNHWEDMNFSIADRSSSKYDIEFVDALASYEDGNHELCLKLLEQMKSTEDASSKREDGNTKLLKAQVYFKQGKYNAMLEKLNTIDETDNIGNDDIYWYSALAYVYAEDIGKAKHNLNIIIERDYRRSENAKKLLRELQAR